MNDDGDLGVILADAIERVNGGGLFDDLFEYYIGCLTSLDESTEALDDIDYARLATFVREQPLQFSPFDCAGHFECLGCTSESRDNLITAIEDFT